MKKIKIGVSLDTREFIKQLNDLLKRKNKIKVDIDSSGIDTTNKKVIHLRRTVNETTTVFGRLKTAIINTFSASRVSMAAYLLALREIHKAGQQMIQSTRELDKAITDLQIATDGSRESVTKLVQDYNKYGKELASTTTQITSSADDWLRAGKTMQEAEILIKDSIMLSKLGKIESSEATKDLLAVMNGYRMTIDEVGRSLDSMVAIDMKAATSAGDIATALKYSASSADLAGLSFNKLSAMIATVQDKTTGSAQTIGTFFNTVLARYRNVKVGKFLDDEGQDISKVETVLDSLNIKLRNTNHEFRDFEQVIDDVAKGWNNYSSVQQSMIAEAFSGSRQQNKFIALMQGYNKTLELTEVAANSAGTALDKFNNSYMTSLEAKQNILKNSFESMVMNSDFDEVYSGIIEATTALVEFINQTNALKGVMTGLVVAGGIKGFLSIRTGINEAYISLNKFQNAMAIVGKTDISTRSFERLLLLSNGLSQSQMKLLLSTKNLTYEQKKQILVNSGLTEQEAKLQLQTWGMTTANNGLTVSTTSLKNAINGLWTTLMANPLILVTMAASAAIMAFSKYKQAQEEVRQAAAEAASTYKDQAANIEETAQKYQDLHKELNNVNTTEERQREIKQELLALQQELNEKYGDEYGRLNLVTDAYKDQTKAIEEYNEAAANYFLNNTKGLEAAEKDMTKPNTYSLGSTGNMSDPNNQYAQDIYNIVSKYQDKGIKLTKFDQNGVSGYTFKFTGDATQVKEVIGDLENEIRTLADKYENNGFIKSILDNSTHALVENNKKIQDSEEIYLQTLNAEIGRNKQLSALRNKATDAVNGYNQAVLDGDESKILDARDNLKQVQNTLGLTEKQTVRYGNIFNDIFDQADTRAYDFTEAIKDNKNGIADIVEGLRGLTQEDVASMANDGDNGDVFDKLKNKATDYKLSVEELIEALVKLGIVQGNVEKEPEIHIFTKSDMISEINNLSEGFEKLDKIYADVKGKGTFDFGNLADDKFVEIFSKDKEAYEDFIETVSSSPTDINACQSAFDKLVGSWLNSTGVLKNVTEDTRDVTVAMLENMGIVNASTLVDKQLANAKAIAAAASFDLKNATSEELIAFIDEQAESENARQAILKYYLEKINANDITLATDGDIKNIMALVEKLGGATKVLESFYKAKQGLYDSGSKILNPDPVDRAFAIPGIPTPKEKELQDQFKKQYEIYQQEAKKAQAEIDAVLNSANTTSYGGGNTSNKDPKGSKKSGKEFSEQLDYIDRLLEVSERKLKEYKNELEDATTIDGKYTAIDKIVGETEYQLKQLQEVYNFYAEKASQTLAQIPEAMREQVKNGTVNIETLNDEKLSKLIKEFYDLDGSVEDTKDKMRDLNKEIDDVKKQKIQIQIEYQERRKDKLERIQQRYEAAISAVTSSVQDEIDAVNKYYDNQIKKIQDQIDALDEENDRLELQRKLEKALYDLRRAENQRTARIYREGKGFVYEADQNAIRDAQQNYDDAMFEKTKFDLQQIIDRLEKERDQEVDYLTEIKDAWSDIADSFQRMADAKVADNLFGTGWLDDILNGDTSLFDEMTDKFGSVFDGIFDADQAIQSFNDLLDSINNGEITTDGAIASMTESLTTLGATTTEQTGIMGSGYTSVATSAETARNLSAETYGMWTENLLIFQEQTLAICNSIIAQFNAMADAVVAAAERAKKAAEDIKEAAESSSGSRDYTSSSSGPGGRSDPGYVDSGPGVHHKGVLAGRVGVNQSSKDNQLATLQEASIRPLKPDERYIRALEGELVFTKEQQSTLFNNINLLGIDTSKLSSPTIDYSKIKPVKPESQTVEYTFNGGIHITEAQNVMDIAKGIKNGTLRMALNQELYKR